jgi:hypothetical protein
LAHTFAAMHREQAMAGAWLFARRLQILFCQSASKGK